MRKVTEQTVKAFLKHEYKSVGKNANVIRTISNNETINVGKPQ
tara:strand:- start:389 stop:517 length:129 start_codon:yes stop_codon:yes gene_type:complete